MIAIRLKSSQIGSVAQLQLSCRLEDKHTNNAWQLLAASANPAEWEAWQGRSFRAAVSELQLFPNKSTPHSTRPQQLSRRRQEPKSIARTILVIQSLYGPQFQERDGHITRSQCTPNPFVNLRSATQAGMLRDGNLTYGRYFGGQH
jgi:hypothetical protein